MSTMTQHRGDATGADQGACPRRPPVGRQPVDPLIEDRLDDAFVVTTERRLRRLVSVACDAGARFARDGLRDDAVAWMLAPRALFDGRRALDACQEYEGFARATLLHGLGLAPDAQPQDLDELLLGELSGEDVSAREGPPTSTPFGSIAARLYTCVLEGADVGSSGRLRAFCALTAFSEDDARDRLRALYGAELCEGAMVCRTAEAGHLLVDALLSPDLRRMLAAPTKPPGGIVLHFEQRSPS